MNEKLVVHFSAEKDGHTFIFSMPVGCPLGLAYDAVHQVLEKITELAKKATEKAKQSDENKDEEAKG